MRAKEFIAEDEPTRIKIGGAEAAAKARAWIERVYARYPQTMQNNHVMPLGGTGDDQQFAMFELTPSFSKRGAVEVKWFQAYPLRSGVGSRAMKELQALAREDGISLTLFPWDKGQVSQNKLTKFYRGQGFAPGVKGGKAMQWTPDQPGVTENSEQISEYRDRLLQYVKSLLPNYPEYVLKDWLVPNKGNFSNLPDTDLKNGIMEKLKGAGLTPNTKWQLVPNMQFTMDMFEPMSKQRLIGRAGGNSDMGLDVPRDKERHATQAALAQQQGGVRKEPVLLIKTDKGYELLEGWHRTIQHFAKYPDGYTGPAYVAVAQQGVAEGALNESAVFLNPTTVIVGQAHGQPLDLSPDTLKKVQAIAVKHGAYYEGNGTDRSYTKGQIDRYTGSWDDEVAKTASPNDSKWLYVLFANVDENNRVQRVGVDPKDTIFNRLLATAQDNSFQGIGYTARALQKFLQMASEGQYDFVKMSQQPATQPNLTRFLKAGEALMWPSNWEQYPNRAGKIAKAATVDVRDQYLATRKAGVYVTGSGHLKAVQNITGQQAMTEGLRVDVPNEEWLNDAIAYAKEKSPDRNGLPYMGKTTATVKEVQVPVSLLKRIPGMRNEQQNVRQNDLAAIIKIMKDTGKLPLHDFTKQEYKPFINVAYDGSAWVNEGNHRIMAAAAQGWKELPVQISYFDGGERIESGPMYPGKIGL